MTTLIVPCLKLFSSLDFSFFDAFDRLFDPMRCMLRFAVKIIIHEINKIRF